MSSETPKTIIVRQLRLLWLRSRERAEAMKLAGYTCKKCGVKRSVAKGQEVKVEVHHKKGIGNWDKVIQVLREEILCSQDELECLCKECHRKETDGI